MKKAIFTVDLGGYDYAPTPPDKNENWDKIIFTDREELHPGWDKTIKVNSDNPKIDSRKYKWLSHLYLSEYDLVCYVDANIQIRRELPTNPFWVQHPKRTSILQECEALKFYPDKVEFSKVSKQVETYYEEGFKDDIGLFQNGLFIRENDEDVNNVCEEVFKQCRTHTNRDQVSFPYAIRKHELEVGTVVGSHYVNHLSVIKPHKQKIKKDDTNKEVKVHHITPGRSDMNYGKALNTIIEGLPKDDWVCVRDMDTIPLLPSKFIRQCEIIAMKGEFQLVSCFTNRLGLQNQLPNGFSGNTDILDEIEIAKNQIERHGSEVEQTEEPVAGLMFLFPIAIWNKVGGFKEGGIIFNNRYIDNDFYSRIHGNGFKVGIAKGIYLFHLYRLGKDKKSIEHLINQ